MVVSSLTISVVFVLDIGSKNSEGNDEHQVEVEPCAEGTFDVLLVLLSEGELVREATSVEADATEEHVATSEGSSNDQNVLVPEERCNSSEKSAGDANDPEDNLASSEEEHGFAEHDTEEEAAPASNESSAESLKLHDKEASNKTDQDGANKHGPANPGLSGIFEESCVEEKEDGKDGESGSNDEDCGLEQFTAKEAKEATNADKEGAPDPCVLIDEVPEGVKIESRADIGTSESR